MVISLVKDKAKAQDSLVMVVLKDRDPDLKTGLVMNVAEGWTSLD
jgi:hypothetical protein